MEFKDWLFVELGPRGELQRTGHVVDKITDGIFLCQVYAQEFTHALPVKAEEMLRWRMFPDKTEMQRFIDANKAALEKAKTPPEPVPEKPEGVSEPPPPAKPKPESRAALDAGEAS